MSSQGEVVGTDEWLLTPRRAGRSEAAFILFPYAGLGASIAAVLSRHLDLPVTIHGVQLPGRESRFSALPFTTMEALVDALMPVITKLADRPFVLMGCSFGAFIAYELASRLAAMDLPPRHLIVLACAAPMLGRYRTGLSRLSDAALLRALDERFGGVPAAIRQDVALQRLFLPTLRADVTLLDGYEWRPRARLRVPLLAIGGRRDTEVGADDLRLWGELVDAPVTPHLIDGGHFVLRENPAAVAAVIDAHVSLSGRSR